MTMRCWDVCDQVVNAYVVFAKNKADAVLLGNQDIASYGGAGSPDMIAIERLPAVTGGSAYHLVAAIARNEKGIGHRQAGGAWLILPPGIRSAQTERAHTKQLHHFVDDDDYQVVLFARNAERAELVYDAIVGSDHQSLPDEWLGSEWDAWNTVGLVPHQRQAERRGVEGVGVYTVEGWQILPLEYDALGILPDD